MEYPIHRLVIVAGPAASGKSTFIRGLYEGQFPEVGRHLGIEDLHEWPLNYLGSTGIITGGAFKGAILHYDFLYRGDRVLQGMERVRTVSVVTLWTPYERIRRHLVTGKLRVRITDSPFEIVKSKLFKLLPLPFILRMSRMRIWWFPRSFFKFHMTTAKIYSQPDQVVRIYRGWFNLCKEFADKTRRHIIIEFDNDMRYYSLGEWEWVIQKQEIQQP